VLFQPFVNYGNKNALSRLPLDQDQHCVDEVEEIICAVETQQLDELPGTDKDVLSQVFNYTLHGLPVLQ